jgi:pimeloyl-ACP methyl ester carboxylesterase
VTRSIVRILGAVYLTLLTASCLVRHTGTAPIRLSPSAATVGLRVVRGDRILDRTIRVAYEQHLPPGDAPPHAVLLVHGSPGSHGDFRRVVPELAKRYRVIVPDLPGFGASEHDVPDYSIRAHGRYLLELMDALGIEDAHVVGFSMGGGVALSMADLARGACTRSPCSRPSVSRRWSSSATTI